MDESKVEKNRMCCYFIPFPFGYYFVFCAVMLTIVEEVAELENKAREVTGTSK